LKSIFDLIIGKLKNKTVKIETVKNFNKYLLEYLLLKKTKTANKTINRGVLATNNIDGEVNNKIKNK
tara:strand:+ start:732 stop:932 length:201 start_codon:yes stop_codon:yes gene_type:complete